MYEKIMVPLDGSGLAEAALPYAEELAAQLGSEMILLSVNQVPGSSQDEPDQRYLQKMVESIKERVARYSLQTGTSQAIKVESVLLSGHPAEKIVNYADAENITMTVMSTHGRSGIRRWALGSVADKVIRASNKPVILIRSKESNADINVEGLLKKVVVPLDGSPEAEAVLPFIEELATRLKLGVILVEVLDRGFNTLDGYFPLTDQQIETDKAIATAYLDKVQTRLKGKGINVSTEEKMNIDVIYGNPAEEIIRLTTEKQADLIGMTTHGRSGVSRQVFGSVAERILREGNTPLMLVKAPGAKVV